LSRALRRSARMNSALRHGSDTCDVQCGLTTANACADTRLRIRAGLRLLSRRSGDFASSGGLQAAAGKHHQASFTAEQSVCIA